MADRYYGKDIIDFLLTLAQNGTKGINAMITTINTERSLTGNDACPSIKSFVDFWTKNKSLPEMFIDMEGSEVENGEDVLGGGGDTIGSSLSARYPDNTPETYTVNMIVTHKSNLTQLTSYMEIFAEAIYRTFHKYTDSNISSILATTSIRDQINTMENQTQKQAGYSFDVRIGD